MASGQVQDEAPLKDEERKSDFDGSPNRMLSR
jgi:hypothetical protein